MNTLVTDTRFDFTPDEIKSLTQKKTEELLKELAKIAAVPQGQATLQNTLEALELCLAEFNNQLSLPIFLKYVSTDAAVREASDVCETHVQKLMVDIFAREDLFIPLSSLEQKSGSFNPVQKLLLEEYLVSFRKNGLGLPVEKRAAYIEKKKRLVDVEAEFQQNLLKENTFLEFSIEELKGLPDSYIQGLEKLPSGKYKVTLSYPHVTPFMENAESNESRKRLALAFNTRGGEKNKKLLEEALKLRQELAQTLGYPTHSHLVISRRMAQTPQAVSDFLQDLLKKLAPLGKRDRENLLALKSEITGKKETTLEPYEWRYLHNRLQKEKYEVDQTIVQKYFPLDVVLKGLFEVYQTLLGVKFTEEPGQPVWHSSVRRFRIDRDGKLVSRFFMDLFPREGKYTHAAAFTLISAYRLPNGEYQKPVSSIVANFTPGNPSLLTHSEVETLFHEFGHIMHQVLTQAAYPSFSGTGVKMDFVEAPSQMLENWTWKKDILKKISSHFEKPGETLPDALIDKMIASKNLNSGLHYLRQLAFATIDLELHSGKPCDSTELYARRMKEILGIPIQEGSMPQASFGHLMGGYDSGYYSYLWSEVFAKDMFTRFEKEGLLNPTTGADYVKWILEPGGEKPPMDLISGFLGRKPNSDAFLKSLGI